MSTHRAANWTIVTRVAQLTASLSFAVLLVDPVAGEQPSGDVTVALADPSTTAVENPSGFHLFLDLTADPVTLVINGGDRYFDERLTVYHSQALPAEASGVEVTDPSTPVVVTLTPTPAYQFMAGTTRIRGTVTTATTNDGDGGVTGATVSLEEFTPEAKTTETGEYVLYVPATADDVVRTNGTRLVKVPREGNSNGSPADSVNGEPSGNNSDPGNSDELSDPELTVRHTDHQTFSREISVEAGVLTRCDIELPQ